MAGDRRRRRARLDACCSIAASSTRSRSAPSSAARASIGIVLLSQERMEATKSRGAVDAAALAGLAAPGRAGAAGRTRPSGTASTSSQPLSLMLIEMDGPSAGYAARRFRTPDAARQRAGRRDRRRARRPVRGARARSTCARRSRAGRGSNSAQRPSRRAVAAGLRAGRDPGAVRDAQARARGARPHRRARPGRRPERAGALLDAVRDARPGEPRGLSRGDDRRR